MFVATQSLLPAAQATHICANLAYQCEHPGVLFRWFFLQPGPSISVCDLRTPGAHVLPTYRNGVLTNMHTHKQPCSLCRFVLPDVQVTARQRFSRHTNFSLSQHAASGVLNTNDCRASVSDPSCSPDWRNVSTCSGRLHEWKAI